MKRKKRRDIEFSPNSLIVPPWEHPIPKKKKIISIISLVILIVSTAILMSDICSSTFFAVFILFVIFITFIFTIRIPMEFLVNKILRNLHNNAFDCFEVDIYDELDEEEKEEDVDGEEVDITLHCHY